MCQLGTGKGKDFPNSKMGRPANLAKSCEGALKCPGAPEAEASPADPSSHQDPVDHVPGLPCTGGFSGRMLTGPKLNVSFEQVNSHFPKAPIAPKCPAALVLP